MSRFVLETDVTMQPHASMREVVILHLEQLK